jgi:hypothetical protein
MSDETIEDRPLDPWMRAALLAEGLDGGPTEAQRSRMAGKLAAALGVSAAALLSTSGSTAAAVAGAAGTTLAGKTAALVVGAVIAGGGLGVAVSELRPRASSAPAVVDARSREHDASQVDASEVPDASVDAILDATPDAIIDATLPVDASKPNPYRDASVSTRPAMTADELARERQLIDVARSALRGNDLQLAAKSLIEHGMRFPHGALVEEQRVLSIELAVAKGDVDGAKAKAAAFRRDYPRSVFRARVDELSPP